MNKQPGIAGKSILSTPKHQVSRVQAAKIQIPNRITPRRPNLTYAASPNNPAQTRIPSRPLTHPQDKTPLLLILQHNPLTHTIHNLPKKLGRMAPGKTNLLCEIIGQKIQQLAIPLLIQQRLVEELGIGIAFAALGDREVEVQSWRVLVYGLCGSEGWGAYCRCALFGGSRIRLRRLRSS